MTQSQSLKSQYQELHESLLNKALTENAYKQKLDEITKSDNLDEIKDKELIVDFVENNDLHALKSLKQSVEKKYPNQDDQDKEYKLLLNIMPIVYKIGSHSNKKTLKFLVEEFKFDPKIRNSFDATILHFVARFNKLEMVKFILENYDININAKDRWKKTALHWVVSTDNLEILKCLISHDKIDINEKDGRGNSALDIAKRKGNEKIINLLNKKIGIAKNSSRISQISQYIDNTIIGTFRRFLTNVMSPVLMALAAPYVKLYSLIASPVMAIADYLFNGKKAKSVVLNSILEIATYVVAGMLVGMFGLSTPVGYAAIIAISATLNVGTNLLDERINFIGGHLLRDSCVESLKKQEARNQNVNINR